MFQNKIEEIIHELNITFEYYFEDYPDIDNHEIWWILVQDPIKKTLKFKHVNNFCKQQGDLAIRYFRYGYCALFAIILKTLFPDGEIYNSQNHTIFFYQNDFYDAGGKINQSENITEEIWDTNNIQHNITINPKFYCKTPEPINLNNMSKYRNINSPSNQEIAKKLITKGFELINQSPSKKRKIEPE